MASVAPSSNGLFTVRFVVTFGVVSALIIAGATVWFVLASDTIRAALIFFAAASAAAGQVGAALYTARTLRFAVDAQAKAATDLEAKEAKLERQQLEAAAAKFGERWTDASMFHLRKASQQIMDNRTNPAALQAAINEDKNLDLNVSNILNFLEELSVSVCKGRCDETIAKSLFCGIVLNTWHATEPWIRAERTRLGRGQLWTELENLYIRWR